MSSFYNIFYCIFCINDEPQYIIDYVFLETHE